MADDKKNIPEAAPPYRLHILLSQMKYTHQHVGYSNCS